MMFARHHSMFARRRFALVPLPPCQPASEEASSSSKDEQEAEQLPTTNPPCQPASEEDSSSNSSSDEHEAEQLPTTNPPIPAPSPPPPAGQQGDSYEGVDEEDNDDEDEPAGSSNVAAKRGPSPPPHLQGLTEPHTLPEVNAPSPNLTKPSTMKRTAAVAELAEPSSSKKAAAAAGKEVAKPPLPSKAAAALARQAAGKEVAYNAEKDLQEKSETYWHLAQALKELERQSNIPGLYNVLFLRIADCKAAMLNTKIKEQTMAEANLFLKRFDINREIMVTMSDLMK